MAKPTKGTKRVLLCGDLHCGHLAGLTPPGWQTKTSDADGPRFLSQHLREKFHRIQAACWDWWRREISKLRPFHLAIVNGDLIDGKGVRSGGTELITADRSEQADMAMKALSIVRAPNWCFTFGTPYHVGSEEDFETRVAEWMDAQTWTDKVKIGGHEWPQVNGLVFDVKHKIGGSSTPYGRATAIEKEDVHNLKWHERGQQPRADILVRSHVHYYYPDPEKIGDDIHRMLVILPALQAMVTKFGSRQCSSPVDYGFCYVDIPPKGERTKTGDRFSWHERLLPTKIEAATVTEF